MLNDKIYYYLESKEAHQKELSKIAEKVQDIAIEEYKKALIAKTEDIYDDYCNGRGKLSDIIEKFINNTNI